MNEYCVLTTSAPSDDAATRMARAIVDARLAACVQRVPIASTYRWQGHVETADEILLIVKTRRSAIAPLTEFIQEHHEYDTPEIVVTPIVAGSDAYLQWIGDQVDAD